MHCGVGQLALLVDSPNNIPWALNTHIIATASRCLTVSLLGLDSQVLARTLAEALVLTTRGRDEGEELRATNTQVCTPTVGQP